MQSIVNGFHAGCRVSDKKPASNRIESHLSILGTIDACVSNQYDQQVRALCGLPLGESRAHSAAVMVNLLGDLWYLKDAHHSHEPDWQRLLDVPNLRLHLYGKHHARHGRKMGHFTVIGSDAMEVQKSALAARRDIGILDD